MLLNQPPNPLWVRKTTRIKLYGGFKALAGGKCAALDTENIKEVLLSRSSWTGAREEKEEETTQDHGLDPRFCLSMWGLQSSKTDCKITTFTPLLNQWTELYNTCTTSSRD